MATKKTTSKTPISKKKIRKESRDKTYGVKFQMNRHNSLFRKYMTKLAIGIKTKNQYKISEVREYMKSKQIDIGYNEDTQKIRLRQFGRIPVDFKISEFVSMSDADTVSVGVKK